MVPPFPSQYRYSLIAKTETSYEDARCILHRLGLDALASEAEKLPEREARQKTLGLFRSSRKFHPNAGQSSDIVAKELFKTLSKTEVMGLYKLFELDFLLFGYSATEYENLAQGE